MKLKRTQADKWFSDCIRISANWRCENCETDYENNKQGLDCSHFFGRGNYSLRFNPMNAFAHCMGCHRKLGENPVLFMDFAEKHLGAHGIEILRALQNDTGLGRLARKADKSGEISKHYRDEYRKIALLREQGDMSTIPVIAWQPQDWEGQDWTRWALDNIS